MLCSDCGYPLRPGQTACPRCRFRRHVEREAAAKSVPALPGATTPATAVPEVPSPAPPQEDSGIPGVTRRLATLVVPVVLALWVGLLVPSLLRAHRRAQAIATQAARARAIFALADGPCRNGQDRPCEDGITALRAMRDRSDASLLLGDLRVSHYFRTLPAGEALEERWRRDNLTGDELTALGNQAWRRRSIVFRSFWMYADVKRNHMDVPTLTINNDRMKF